MATPWVRLWSDMPNDPKWRTISKIAKQPIPVVISVYVHMLVCASNATERGRTQGWNDEDIGSALDVEPSAVSEIRNAMQGRVLDGDCLTGWEKRQPVREDGAAERAKAWREVKKQEIERSRTQPNAPERPEIDTEIDKENNITPLPSDDDVRKCPVGSLVDLYHELMPLNPRVKVLGDDRKKAIRARWRQAAELECEPFGYSTKSQGLIAWRAFFEICAVSDFLTGKAQAQPGKPPFVADIDFIFSPSGFARTLENKYHREAK